MYNFAAILASYILYPARVVTAARKPVNLPSHGLNLIEFLSSICCRFFCSVTFLYAIVFAVFCETV